MVALLPIFFILGAFGLGFGYHEVLCKNNSWSYCSIRLHSASEASIPILYERSEWFAFY